MGRPPKYKTALELQEKIQEYFDTLSETNKITITGLVLHCGFESRQAFYHLEQKDEFRYIIKRSRLKVENHYEKLLQGNMVAGPVFALKNMGWTDKQEIDHTSKGDKINTQPSIVVSDQKTADELKKLLDAND